MPWVFVIIKTAFLEVIIIGNIWLQNHIRMDAIITLIRFKPNLCVMYANCTGWIDAKALHPFLIWDHVRLAHQNRAYAQRLEMITNVLLTHPQRHKICRRTVRGWITSRVNAHPAGATNWRLHVSVGKAHAALCQRVDVGRVQSVVTRARKIVITQLITHDEEYIFAL